MKYELKISAMSGDVIPLYHVADAMARAASTAYGKTPSHEPIFKYQLPIHIKSLLREARANRLIVCNQIGYQSTAEEIIGDAKNSGDLSEVRRYLEEPDWEKLHRENPPVIEGIDVWDFTEIDLGPTEIDWDTTNILCLYTKLHHLNEWGKTRGDEFSIADECAGWIDERGYMNANAGQAAPATSAPQISQANKLRRDVLDPAIDKAVEQAGSMELADVYLKLKELAKDEEPPFTGIFDGDALCYTDTNDNRAQISKEALGKRLKRRAEKAATN